MKTYTFWNNKGGTGKTSLCFQTSVQYALDHPNENVLVIDLCPQADLSELMLGGMVYNGGINLQQLFANPRISVGGYIQLRTQHPYSMVPAIIPHTFICKPHNLGNPNIPNNLDLLAGDPIIELEVPSMSNLSSIQIPTVNTFVQVVSWIKDFIHAVQNDYDIVFIDTNPSFAIYTQMAITASDFLLIPLTADNSSIRAIHNVLHLVYGVNNTNPYSYYSKMIQAGNTPPKIHMIFKNRMTQYMGTSRAYSAVLNSINSVTQWLMQQQWILSNNFASLDIRDFQSTGVVAYAEALTFSQLQAGQHQIGGSVPTPITADYIRLCKNEILKITNKL